MHVTTIAIEGTMIRIRPLLILIACVGVILTACGGTSSDEGRAPADEVQITIEDFDFGDPTTAGIGDTIRISNKDGVAHTWTSADELFNSGSIGPEGDFTFSFDEAGNYEFFCSIHPSMTGSISISG